MPLCESSVARKIRPGSDAISTWWSTLAWRPTTCFIQAVSAGVQVFTWLGSAVSCRAMCTDRQCHSVPQAPLCHLRITKFSSVQHGKLWPTGFLIHWPSRLELTARIPTTKTSIDLFKRSLKTLLFGQISLAAHYRLLFNGLYKFTYLVTFINIAWKLLRNSANGQLDWLAQWHWWKEWRSQPRAMYIDHSCMLWVFVGYKYLFVCLENWFVTDRKILERCVNSVMFLMHTSFDIVNGECTRATG